MELANRWYMYLATQEFSLENANEALQALNGEKVQGHAVLVT